MTKSPNSDVRDFIRAHQCFLVTSHVQPDPDAVGSSGALVHSLNALGKSARWLLQDPIPATMSGLVPSGMLPLSSAELLDAEALIVVDVASADRIGRAASELLASASASLTIDHHISNDGFCDVNWIDDSFSSSCEMVFSLLRSVDAPIDDVSSRLLLAGLMDDTGCFRFSNTNACSFETAASLVSLGADPSEVAQQLYFSLPRRVLALRVDALQSMKFFLDGRLGFVAVTRDMLARHGASSEETTGIVEEARKVAGTEAIVFARERENDWKLSLRAKTRELDVSAIAADFGGGGHVAAAGCSMTGTLDEIEAQLVGRFSNVL